jgi:hypothetical protein
MKKQFTDEEVDELCDLHMNHGEIKSFYEILKYLKEKFNYSNTHNIIIELRKEFQNKQHSDMWDKFHEKYKGSTLQLKLLKRLENE